MDNDKEELLHGQPCSRSSPITMSPLSLSPSAPDIAGEDLENRQNYPGKQQDQQSRKGKGVGKENGRQDGQGFLLPTLALLSVCFLFASSGTGIAFSILVVVWPVTGGYGLPSRVVVFVACILDLVYVGIHLVAARSEYRKKAHGAPQIYGNYLHASGLLLVRLGVPVHITAVVTTALVVAKMGMDFSSQIDKSRLTIYVNSLVSIVGFLANCVLLFCIELSPTPFATIFVSKRSFLASGGRPAVEDRFAQIKAPVLSPVHRAWRPPQRSAGSIDASSLKQPLSSPKSRSIHGHDILPPVPSSLRPSSSETIIARGGGDQAAMREPTVPAVLASSLSSSSASVVRATSVTRSSTTSSSFPYLSSNSPASSGSRKTWVVTKLGPPSQWAKSPLPSRAAGAQPAVQRRPMSSQPRIPPGTFGDDEASIATGPPPQSQSQLQAVEGDRIPPLPTLAPWILPPTVIAPSPRSMPLRSNPPFAPPLPLSLRGPKAAADAATSHKATASGFHGPPDPSVPLLTALTSSPTVSLPPSSMSTSQLRRPLTAPESGVFPPPLIRDFSEMPPEFRQVPKRKLVGRNQQRRRSGTSTYSYDSDSVRNSKYTFGSDYEDEPDEEQGVVIGRQPSRTVRRVQKERETVGRDSESRSRAKQNFSRPLVRSRSMSTVSRQPMSDEWKKPSDTTTGFV